MKIRTESGHFWITYDNGYEISVFNGYGSHTENYFPNMAIAEALNRKFWESECVEITIFYNNNMITDKYLECDDLVKTINLSELLEIMCKLLNEEGENK